MNLSGASIGQLMIPVDDFDRGLAFYRDALGLPFLFAAPPQMAFFMCGNVRLLVGVLPPGEKAQRGSAIYFRVPDIDAVHSDLQAKGVKFRAAPHLVHRTPQSELWLAEFTDPDGNQLALMEERKPR
ncbi:MAG TPA: VOC family protein [Burkholderiales bacterium]|jgi:methylmalonyl-CoA/ethylmalonyl-CoA epimerase|nr:VOC family protein [Burkholderiales bacterium]